MTGLQERIKRKILYKPRLLGWCTKSWMGSFTKMKNCVKPVPVAAFGDHQKQRPKKQKNFQVPTSTSQLVLKKQKT